MKITVVGAGNAGSTIAADLSLKGHEVTILKTSQNMHNDHYDFVKAHGYITLDELGEEKRAKISCITTEYAEAISEDTELIIIYVQTNYHEQVIMKIAPYLHDGQMILFEPGYLSTAYLLKSTEKRVISIEAESSPIDCRIVSPGRCTVLFKNVRNPIGIYPKNKTEETFEKLKALDYHFVLTDSVVEAALHNPNLIVHTIGAIMSIPRIEYSNGEYWMYKEVFTPKVWNLVESLDAEKMDVLGALGIRPIRYVEACKYRNFKDDEIDAKEAFFDYANNHSPKGPSVPDSRYITEDVSQGLCLLESLGSVLNIETRVTTALIDIASALLCCDFRTKGRNVTRLGNANIQKIIEDTGKRGMQK